MFRFSFLVILATVFFHKSFAFADLENQVLTYNKAYRLKSLHQKLVDYNGRYLGPAGHTLEGLKNVKMALPGVLYWGGGLNKNRDNRNPLRPTALSHLCKEGFSSSIYLYTKGFDSAVTESHCRNFQGENNIIKYFSMTAGSQSKEIMARIHQTITGQSTGPIYLHCWNGLHASNAVAAVALKQFCGYSNDQAIRFWKTNAEGTDRRENFSGLLNFIRQFQPYSEFQISDSEKQLICLPR